MIDVKTLEDFRLFILSLGFFMDISNPVGLTYVLLKERGNLVFEYRAEESKIVCRMPDFQYNAMYPHAGRNRTYTLTISDYSCASKDVLEFIDKMTKLYENKGEALL